MNAWLSSLIPRWVIAFLFRNFQSYIADSSRMKRNSWSIDFCTRGSEKKEIWNNPGEFCAFSMLRLDVEIAFFLYPSTFWHNSIIRWALHNRKFLFVQPFTNIQAMLKIFWIFSVIPYSTFVYQDFVWWNKYYEYSK